MTNKERTRLELITGVLAIICLVMVGGQILSWFFLKVSVPTLYRIVLDLFAGAVARLAYLLEIVPSHAERSLALGSSAEKKLAFRGATQKRLTFRGTIQRRG